MRRLLGISLLLPIALLWVALHGDSSGTLNRLAAAGQIHEGAPVKAHVQIQIAAPSAKVWAMLVDVTAWPKWQKGIESVKMDGPLGSGSHFSWKTGGTEIHSQVQLFEPERRLSWTGTALTAKAIHVWTLEPASANQTVVTIDESMEGPLMARLYPSEKLVEADGRWLEALKQAAER